MQQEWKYCRKRERGFVWVAMVVALGITPLNMMGVELIPLLKPLDQINQSFSQSEAAMILGATVSLISKDETASIKENLLSIIDADRASGISLQKKGEYQFLFNLKKFSRIHMLTVAGNQLQGIKVSLKLAGEPLAPGERGWNVVVENQALKSPVTSIVFNAQSTVWAILAFQVPSNSTQNSPFVSDVGLYANKDVREFELLLSTDPRVTQRKEKPISTEVIGGEKSPFDLACMYSGAHVAYISFLGKVEKANQVNDGNPGTFYNFSPNEKESVLVMDLGQRRRFSKISILHSQQVGKLICYVVDQLPWTREEGLASFAWLDRAVKFTLVQLPSKPTNFPKVIQVEPSLFEKLPSMGTVDTGSHTCSSLSNEQNVEGRYLIVRFMNGAVGSGIGFRIYDINLTGGYSPNYFVLMPRKLPLLKGDVLIRAEPTTDESEAGNEIIDLSKVRNAIPPPISPSSP